ncbi:DNA polymerase III subunit alpha [Patescibacteria group bacterium]|nr:DNA polymerase III subunit alpha [Patescibacteria group bacterium]
MANYVSLHTHSEYSLLDGLSKFKDLLARAKEWEMPALAITDHGTMYGAIKFYLAAKEAGIKPILGVEAYQAEKSRLDRSGSGRDQYHLILLAKNLNGYKNLMKIVTAGHLEGFYYKPRIDWEVLEKYHEGIIATSACNLGMIGKALEKDDWKKAEEIALRYQKIFGEGNFYLEIQHHPGLEKINETYEKLAKLSRKLSIPLVATNDSHYTKKEDADGQETLLCIQTQKTWLDKDRPMSMIDVPDFYFKSPEEMSKSFAQYPDALENTLKIADMVDLDIPMDKYIFPHFPLPGGETMDSYLEKLVEERVYNRYPEVTADVTARIAHEMDIIESMGYSSYFLIVSDFANWAMNNGVMRNARGSGAGSIISYILGISTIDPLLYKLPFERFLHKQRPSPPDIDMDLADDGREKVLDYVRQKYGADKVAQIITFGTMEAKAAVRDVARALGYPYAVGDRLSKMIPPGSQGFPMYIDRALETNAELKAAYDNEEDTKKIIDMAKKVEGVARHASVHAAGVIISDKSLTEYVPLQLDPKGGKVITQYDMYALDLNASKHAVGLLKMDFLGLRNLTILGQALKFVEENTGKKINLEKIPLDDKEVYAMIARGDTTGVFQLESGGMRKLAKDLQPSVISDLGAMVALYRPGPLEIIPDFVKAKRHPELVRYLHEDLKPILEETYGFIIYQEQAMEIAHAMGGYTMAEADGFRKAIGKKKPELMKVEGEKLKAGMVKNGYSGDLADKIFALIEKFAAYGFNKAHSADYGMIAYETAYMKYHYPVEYMTAMLTAESRGNTGDTKDEKIQMCIEECRRMKIPVLPPDINKSGTEFNIEGRSIRFGLSAIKNVGAAAIDSILKARDLEEPFRSLSDFARRVDLQKVNKKTLESLIKAGAMDQFGKRSAMLESLEKVISESHKLAKQISSGQTGLFDTGDKTDEEKKESVSFELPDVEERPKEELLLWEREYLGFYLSEHPAQKALEKIVDLITHEIGELSEDLHVNKTVTTGGMVTSTRKVLTKKNNDEMAFMTLTGRDGTKLDCVIFPKLYASFGKDLCVENNVIICTGRVDNRDGKLSLIVDTMKKVG